MMPGIARVVHALLSRGEERAVARGDTRIGTHHHQPRLLVQRHEQLAAQRMTLHHLDQDRARPQRSRKQADVDGSAFRRHVDLREAVETLGEAIVDQLRLRIFGLYHLAERREGRFGQGCNRQRQHTLTIRSAAAGEGPAATVVYEAAADGASPAPSAAAAGSISPLSTRWARSRSMSPSHEAIATVATQLPI